MGYGTSFRKASRVARRYAPTFKRVAKVAYAIGKKYYGQQTNQRRNRVTAGTGVTTQRDAKTIYVKKTMPRRQKKRWSTFKRKVRAAVDTKGTASIVFNDENVMTIAYQSATSVKQQGAQCCHLKGASGDILVYDLGSLDLSRIANNDGQLERSSKFTVTSAVLDITFTNPGTASYDGPLEVDVYEIVYGKKRPDAGGLIEILSDGTVQTSTWNVSNTKCDLTYRGVTPFDLPESLSIGSIRILRKTKYFVPYHDSVTYQVRDPKNVVYNRDDFNDPQKGYIGKGTKSVMAIFKPTVTPNSPSTASFALTTKCTRSYKYTVDDVTEDRSAFIA